MKVYPGGATTNIGFRAFAGFTGPANMSGTWRFQIYYDQSRGGFWCIDANCTWAQGMGNDLWEGELAEGYHSFEHMGYEKCCHSLGAVLAQPPGWDYFGNFSLAMLGAASPSPTVSPTTSVVPTVSAPPTRADDCFAQPDDLDFCDAYLDECHTIMNPLEGACDYEGAPYNCGFWGGHCDTTCGYESTCDDRSVEGKCLF